MQQYFFSLVFATLIIPTTFATPLQSPSLPQICGTQSATPGDSFVADWSSSKFDVPSPPPWQGTDYKVVARPSCLGGAATALCCTGNYDPYQKYALQPCFCCLNPPLIVALSGRV